MEQKHLEDIDLVLVVTEFSQVDWTLQKKEKASRTWNEAFSSIPQGSSKKSNLSESEAGTEYKKKSKLLKNRNVKKDSRSTFQGGCFYGKL